MAFHMLRTKSKDIRSRKLISKCCLQKGGHVVLTSKCLKQHQNCCWQPIQPLIWIILFYNINTLRPKQDGRRFPDEIFSCILLTENISILMNISLKSIPKGKVNNIPALVQIMAWRRPGDKALSEPMMVWLLMHICVNRPQWVNILRPRQHVCHFAYYIFNNVFLNQSGWFR